MSERFNACFTTLQIATFVLIAISLGCSSLKPDWKWPGETEPQIPESVLPIWSDTVLHQPGKPGVRGFGGRVYFYAEEGGDPIPVDGSLTVYAFDGENLEATSGKPLRKFVITADQLAQHHSSSDLGDSYSIWIPWDKVGGPSKSLNLIARFDGRNGGTAISDASSKLLPGVKKQADVASDEQQSAASNVRQVGFESEPEDAEQEETTTKHLRSYSLTLPPNFQRHLVGPQQDRAQPESNPLPSFNQQQGQAVATAPGPEEAWQEDESRADAEQASEADSERSRYPVQRTPMSQRVFAPRRSQRTRAKWQSGLPPTPRSPMAIQD
jgi:hypothetical protein